MVKQVLKVIEANQPVSYWQAIQACLVGGIGVVRSKTIIASLLEMGIVVKDREWNLQLGNDDIRMDSLSGIKECPK